MLLTKTSADGALLESCRIKWNAGERVAQLPKFLQPLAILLRNLRLYLAWMTKSAEVTESESEFTRQLNIGLKHLYQSGATGDIAIFGAGSGKVATTIANTISTLSSRKLLIFDSFQGFPMAESEIDSDSPYAKNGLWEPGTGLKINMEDLQDACKQILPKERLQIFAGWFNESLSKIPAGTQLSAVYIDCKMYKPTLDVLNYLLSKNLLLPGAMLFFENWDAGQTPPKFGESKAFTDLLQSFDVAFTDCGTLGWGGKRILIQSYAPVSKLNMRHKFFTNLSDWEDDAKRHFAMGVNYVFEAGVKGDVAEFGTCEGRSAAWIAKPLTKYDGSYNAGGDERFKPKRFFLFDSYEGLPESESPVDQESPHVKAGVWGAGTMKALSPEEITDLCGLFMPRERIITVKGWFKDTIHRIPRDTKFSLVHVDCDLYQSAIDILDGLFSYGMLSEGAVLYFDDWNPNHASPHYGERKAWPEIVAKYSVNYSDWGYYGWGCAKFIVHSYEPTRQVVLNNVASLVSA